MSNTESLHGLEAAIAAMKEALQADGADLEATALSGDVATVRLVVGPETCMDCIMPKEFIEEILLTEIRSHFPDITTVAVEDPRTTSA